METHFGVATWRRAVLALDLRDRRVGVHLNSLGACAIAIKPRGHVDAAQILKRCQRRRSRSAKCQRRVWQAHVRLAVVGTKLPGIRNLGHETSSRASESLGFASSGAFYFKRSPNALLR